jgi:hypothetical protein
VAALVKGLWVMTLVKRPAGWKLAALGSFLATTPAP